MGCDMIQGYLLTPPLPFDELVAWLANQSGAGVTRKIV